MTDHTRDPPTDDPGWRWVDWRWEMTFPRRWRDDPVQRSLPERGRLKPRILEEQIQCKSCTRVECRVGLRQFGGPHGIMLRWPLPDFNPEWLAPTFRSEAWSRADGENMVATLDGAIPFER